MAELGLLLVTHRLFERYRRLGRALDRLDLIGLYPGVLGDLSGSRLADSSVRACAPPGRSVQLLDHVHGDADSARLVGQSASDGLADHQVA